MASTISSRFGKKRPAAVGGGSSCACSNDAEMLHKEKCQTQRIPVRGNVSAPTIDGAGNVTRPGTIEIEPNHYGDYFVPHTIFLTAEYLDENNNLVDAGEAYLRYIEVGKENYDCLAKDEEYGIPVNSFSSEECCDGKPFCAPAFENSDKGNKTLSLEFVNHQVERQDDGSFVAREVRIRGYIVGECRNCGYEKHCKLPDDPMPR